MGRMHDALRKAAEEREARRLMKERRGREEDTPALTTPYQDEVPSLREEEPVEAPPPPGKRRGEGRKRRGRRSRPGNAGRGKDEDTRPAPAPEAPAAGTPARRRQPGASRAEAVPYQGPGSSRGRSRRFALEVDERVVVFHNVRDERSEQFRVLRSNLNAMDPAPTRILVTSGSHDEGKSLVVANLAAAFAERGGNKVLMIDANLRHPELHQLFTCRSAPGVSEFLEGAVDEIRPLILPTGIPNVDILPAGEIPPNPGALWVYNALRALLDAVPDVYDHVLVDTPALDDYADASVMAPDADGVLLVVRIGSTAKALTQHALEILESSQARVVGAFATNAR